MKIPISVSSPPVLVRDGEETKVHGKEAYIVCNLFICRTNATWLVGICRAAALDGFCHGRTSTRICLSEIEGKPWSAN